jgi:DNA-binding transcriptional ArsR family regulator
MHRPASRSALLLAASLLLSWAVFAQSERVARFPAMSRAAEEKGLAEPFKGITTNGEIVKGLFPVRSTGVSTGPVRIAAEKFLAALSEEQRRKTLFAVDDLEWRKWMNQSFYVRQGVGFGEMSEAQREAAFGLMRASLSAKGVKLSRDIMKLNHTLGELNHDNFVEYGEWLYWITVMGTPSATEPWGWQLDGHHLIINYFVLGDQVVMTPSFFGSEPARATAGKYRGTRIMQEEQDAGLAFVKSLTKEQLTAATLRTAKDGNDNLTEAFKDNVVLDYAGVPARTLSAAQKRQLLGLIGLYVHNMRDEHARVRIDEVNARLDETYFAWIGGIESDSVYYYRIHSPVVLIEFDHQKPANLRHLYPDKPYRDHIHAVMRTPNGNDYGKDLLRQHYAEHPH